MIYRPEIDGLRAIAVSSVVVFHASRDWLPGGFTGVDVFFVISGYLITRLILEELHEGRFSFAGFYERRARRILPALLVVLTATLIGVYLVGLPNHLVDSAWSAGAAVFAVSNIHFWQSSGYFAPAAEFMPLLHTWSLGVEEQFYLLFPVFLLLLAKLRLPIGLCLALLLVPLFPLSLWLSIEKPSVAFYLLPSRAWELLLGAALAAGAFPSVRSPVIAETMATAGLVMIVTGFFLIDPGMWFPGWAALLPCVGTALVILGTAHGRIIRAVLALPALVFIGLISYSLYLWHWPVLVLLRMWSAEMHLPADLALAGITASVALAAVTWMFVERPVRNRARMPKRRAAMTIGAMLAAVALIALPAIREAGFPSRFTQPVLSMMAAAQDLDPWRGPCSQYRERGREAECRFGDAAGEVSYVIVGDSHAAAMRPAIEALSFVAGRSGTLWWHGGCPFIPGADVLPRADATQCAALKSRILNDIAASPDIELVFMVNRWTPLLTSIRPDTGGSYRVYLVDDQTNEPSIEESRSVLERRMAAAIEELTRHGKKVIVIGAVPEPGFDVPQIGALRERNGRGVSAGLAREQVALVNAPIDLALSAAASRHGDAIYVPIWDLLCEADCALVIDGVPLFYDDDHLSRSAAERIVSPLIDRRLREASGNAG